MSLKKCKKSGQNCSGTHQLLVHANDINLLGENRGLSLHKFNLTVLSVHGQKMLDKVLYGNNK
jgi:hypothetical protein